MDAERTEAVRALTSTCLVYCGMYIQLIVLAQALDGLSTAVVLLYSLGARAARRCPIALALALALAVALESSPDPNPNPNQVRAGG